MITEMKRTITAIEYITGIARLDTTELKRVNHRRNQF